MDDLNRNEWTVSFRTDGRLGQNMQVIGSSGKKSSKDCFWKGGRDSNLRAVPLYRIKIRTTISSEANVIIHTVTGSEAEISFKI